MKMYELLPGAPGPACRPRAARNEPFAGWYAHCCAYLDLPARLQRPVSRQTFATYRRIQALPQAWGTTLDLHGAPLAVVRFIAWGQAIEDRKRRMEEALAFRRKTGKWPRAQGTGSAMSTTAASDAVVSPPRERGEREARSTL